MPNFSHFLIIFTGALFSVTIAVGSIPPWIIFYSQGSSPTVNMFLSSSRQWFSMTIELSSLYFWVPNISNTMSQVSKFDDSTSEPQTLSEGKRNYYYNDNRKVYGNYIYNSIWFGQKQYQKILFLSVSESNDFPSASGVIGLGNSGLAPKNKLSLITQLYRKRLINHRVFSIEFSINKGNKWTIGELPSFVISSPEKYVTCSTRTDNEVDFSTVGWECWSEGLLLGRDISGDKRINIENTKVKIKFDWNSFKTLIPVTYLLKLENTIFQDLISSGTCNFGVKKTYYTFTCENGSYSNIPDITILFDSMGVVTPKEKLFKYDKESSEYEFVFYGKEDNNDIWLTVSYMENYWMVFDQENESVGFYGDTQFIAIKKGVTPPSPKRYDDNNLFSDNENIPPESSKEGEGNVEVVIPIPERPGNERESTERSVIMKIFSFIGLMFIVFCGLFFVWVTLRYFKRKKYMNPAYYYRATDELFNEGTQWE